MPAAAWRSSSTQRMVRVDTWQMPTPARNLTVDNDNDETAAQVSAVVVGGFLDDIERLLPPRR